MKPVEIIALGATIAVIGAIISAWGTYLQNVRSSAKSDRQLAEIAQLQKQGKETAKTALEQANSQMAELLNLSKQNRDLTDELLDLRSENSRLHKSLLENVTGGESYCYVTVHIQPIPFPNSAPKAIFTLHQVGEYAIKDVEVDIISMDGILMFKTSDAITPTAGTVPAIEGGSFVLHKEFKALTPGDRGQLGEMDIVYRTEKAFNVIIRGNGKVWFERIMSRRAKDFPGEEWKIPSGVAANEDYYVSAYQVYTIHTPDIYNPDLDRVENIIGEGTDWSFVLHTTGKPDGEYEHLRYWEEYVFYKNETSPFDEYRRLHWGGGMIHYRKGPDNVEQCYQINKSHP